MGLSTSTDQLIINFFKRKQFIELDNYIHHHIIPIYLENNYTIYHMALFEAMFLTEKENTSIYTILTKYIYRLPAMNTPIQKKCYLIIEQKNYNITEQHDNKHINISFLTPLHLLEKLKHKIDIMLFKRWKCYFTTICEINEIPLDVEVKSIIKQDYDIKSCIVCLDKDREILIKNCRHVCVCKICINIIEKCPICLEKINQTESVILS